MREQDDVVEFAPAVLSEGLT